MPPSVPAFPSSITITARLTIQPGETPRNPYPVRYLITRRSLSNAVQPPASYAVHPGALTRMLRLGFCIYTQVICSAELAASDCLYRF